MSERPEARPRRLVSRYALALPVRVQSAHLPSTSCEAHNVSVGGMFLALPSDRTPELLSELQVTLTLPGSQRSAKLGARVVHALSAARARALGLTPGIGIQLERFDQQGLALVSDLVAWARERDPRPRIAHLKTGADRGLIQHEPMLGFLLEYIDGKRDPEALAQELALDLDTIERMLGELSKLGVVELLAARRGGGVSSPPQPAAARASQQPLPAALKDELTTLEARLPTADYYELLGVQHNASPEQARSAYIARNAELHASIRPPAEAKRIDRVLGRLRDAANVLSHAEQKDEYDEYMERAEWLKAAEAMRTRVSAPPLEFSEEAETKAARSQPSAAKQIARVRASRPPATEIDDMLPRNASLRAPRVPTLDRDARPTLRPGSQNIDLPAPRAAADLPARRAQSLPPSAASQPPAAAPNTARLHAARVRKNSMRPSAAPTKDARSAAAQILAQAEAAFAAGHTTEASRHLTLLSAMTFDDPRVKARLDEIKVKVVRAAAVDFEKQAAYEEKHQRWALAAASWLRVAKGRPNDSYPLHRAAAAQLQAGVELRLVMETAKRAVEISQNDAQAHRTLAKVYMAADMQASARRELELAQRCSPSGDAQDEAKAAGLLQRLLGRDDED